MNKEKVKVEDIVAHLNSLVGDMVNIRVKDADHHKKIMDRCGEYLNSVGLDFKTWGACLKWDGSDGIHFYDSLLQYTTPNFKKDARVKHSLHGRLTGQPVWIAEYRSYARDQNNPLIVTPGPGMTLRQYVLKIESMERWSTAKHLLDHMTQLNTSMANVNEQYKAALQSAKIIDDIIQKEATHES